ncbi:hypothetical protein ACV1DV_21845 [Aeromonas veronii]
MRKFYDIAKLGRREVTALLHKLEHNSANDAEGILEYVCGKANRFDQRRAKATARHTLRRLKKARKAGRIPFETNANGCRIDRGNHHIDRYYYDERLTSADGWQQYDTDQDAWYFGVWINTKKLETFTYAEGDTYHVIAPNVEAFRAELADLYKSYPQAPAFRSIDIETGQITHYYEDKPEV